MREKEGKKEKERERNLRLVFCIAWAVIFFKTALFLNFISQQVSLTFASIAKYPPYKEKQISILLYKMNRIVDHARLKSGGFVLQNVAGSFAGLPI